MYGSELVSDPPREPTSSIAIDYNFQRITSNERGIGEIPLINADFADAGSLIFAGPTAFSLKKKKAIPRWGRHVQRDHRIWLVSIQGRKCKLSHKSPQGSAEKFEKSYDCLLHRKYLLLWLDRLPEIEFPINFVFTKLVTCLPCCPTILN